LVVDAGGVAITSRESHAKRQRYYSPQSERGGAGPPAGITGTHNGNSQHSALDG